MIGKIPPLSYILHNGINARGEQMIYLRSYICGSYKFRSTGFQVKPSDWDVVKQRVLPSEPQAERINKRLEKMLSAVRTALGEVEGRITPRVLDEAMERHYVFERDRAFITPFAQYAHQVNEAAYAAGKEGYVKYDEKRNAIKAFEHYTTFFAGRRNLMLSEIEPYLIEGYVKYRREVLENTNEEVIVRSLRPVIAAAKAAGEEGLLAQKLVGKILVLYDQLAAKAPEDDESAEPTIFLKEDDFQRLDAYAEENPSARDAIDTFLFSYYACGMKFSEIMTLEWKDITEGRITRRSPRTGASAALRLPVSSKAREVLDRWDGRSDRFIFALLPEDIDSSSLALIKPYRVKAAAEIGRVLCVAGRKLGLRGKLTFSAARHSFVKAALEKGMNLYTVSRLLGHADLNVTARQYSGLLKEIFEKDLVGISILSRISSASSIR